MTTTLTNTTPSPTAPPTRTELVARATALQGLLREHAGQIEADRRVTDEVIDALTEAGLFRLTVARRFGGYETDVRTILDVSAAIAEGDGSTGWVVTLVNTCNWLAGLFSPQAQDDVFGADPDTRVTGVFSPTSSSRKVAGGWRLTGRWYYNSGSWHSTWAVLAMPLTDAGGEVIDQAMVLVPRTELEMEDVWFTAGMRGSGSNCLIATDVFVPEHRVASLPGAIDGTADNGHGEAGLYRSSFAPFVATVLGGAQLGLGRAALKLVTGKARTKPISYTYYETQADSVAVQLQVAEAAMKIDTAELHLHRAATDIDEAAAHGTHLDVLTRARVRADTGHAIHNVLDAINTLLNVHGGGSFADTNPLQRIWRDANTAGRHAVATPAVGMEIYGKLLLGVEERITPFI
ncbi:acyl-CoA dehydrogenase family protein [Streptomyces zagrosensis]|uniref:Alkylation response protein AidB-like acyl-CoA dehydrogenase n=1 Tax=Streptomyces zagrosensis TaxID=1042984 RepID=A0A7W9QD41_9ACTN|nr:acyl-CoA dehydrogenase family protein [Streptomyces zagrosensis]MBB5937896.1 alkylation response protein AidB-like acyl-CoA dehydrogenase [Streptomyces zagrosensis]